MKNIGIKASIVGAICNIALVLTKLYVSISTNSLAIYCDAINNLGDTIGCVIALVGFAIAKDIGERKAKRSESLATFVISIIIAATGAYFVYNGVQRIMYPLRISYTNSYALIILATVFAKALMGIMYYCFNKKQSSPVFRALIMDSFLDCAITIFALMGLFLVARVNLAIDGIFALIMGGAITISSIKNIVNETKFLIND